MLRKTKKTDLAPKSGEQTQVRSMAPRSTADWFAEMDRWFDNLRNEFEQRFWGPIAPFEREGGLTNRQPPPWTWQTTAANSSSRRSCPA